MKRCVMFHIVYHLCFSYNWSESLQVAQHVRWVPVLWIHLDKQHSERVD